MRYEGKCHCGAIGYSYETSLPPERWTLRACQCSFCRAHGALTTSDPTGSVEFLASNRNFLVEYRFELRTADFLICAGCGVYIGAVIEGGGKHFALVNVNALTAGIGGLRAAEPRSYEGENAQQRAWRRQRSWTPCRPIRS